MERAETSQMQNIGNYTQTHRSHIKQLIRKTVHVFPIPWNDLNRLPRDLSPVFCANGSALLSCMCWERDLCCTAKEGREVLRTLKKTPNPTKSSNNQSASVSSINLPLDLDGTCSPWQQGERRDSFCLALILEGGRSERAWLLPRLCYPVPRWKRRPVCFPGAASFPTARGGWRREARGRRRNPQFPQDLRSMCEVAHPLSWNNSLHTPTATEGLW